MILPLGGMVCAIFLLVYLLNKEYRAKSSAGDVALLKNDETGNWCSSSYYGHLPAWVEAKN